MHNQGSVQDIRSQLQAAIASSAGGLAASLIRALWRRTGDAATASFIRRTALRNSELLGLRAVRVVMLRSTTIEPVVPVFEAEAVTHGLLADVKVGRFGTWAEDLLNAEGDAYAENKDAVILVVHLADIAPSL